MYVCAYVCMVCILIAAIRTARRGGQQTTAADMQLALESFFAARGVQLPGAFTIGEIISKPWHIHTYIHT